MIKSGNKTKSGKPVVNYGLYKKKHLKPKCNHNKCRNLGFCAFSKDSLSERNTKYKRDKKANKSKNKHKKKNKNVNQCCDKKDSGIIDPAFEQVPQTIPELVTQVKDLVKRVEEYEEVVRNIKSKEDSENVKHANKSLEKPKEQYSDKDNEVTKPVTEEVYGQTDKGQDDHKVDPESVQPVEEKQNEEPLDEELLDSDSRGTDRAIEGDLLVEQDLGECVLQVGYEADKIANIIDDKPEDSVKQFEEDVEGDNNTNRTSDQPQSKPSEDADSVPRNLGPKNSELSKIKSFGVFNFCESTSDSTFINMGRDRARPNNTVYARYFDNSIEDLSSRACISEEDESEGFECRDDYEICDCDFCDCELSDCETCDCESNLSLDSEEYLDCNDDASMDNLDDDYNNSSSLDNHALHNYWFRNT